MSNERGASDPMRDALKEVLALATWSYTDARARSNAIRATTLTALGFLGVLGGFAGPKAVQALNWYSTPGLVALAVGLALCLAVLLQAPVVVPYDTLRLDRAFMECDEAARLEEELVCMKKAEATTRSCNNRSAVLVNLSLSSFAFAVALFACQLGFGAENEVAGLCVGVSVGILVLGVGWLLYFHLLPGKTKKRGVATDER